MFNYTSFENLTIFNSTSMDDTVLSEPTLPWHNSSSMALWIFKASAMVLLIILTVLGNLLVLVGVATSVRLRSPSYFLIANLAAADLLLGVAVLPVSAARELFDYKLSPLLCALWSSLDVLCCTASIVCLCLLALERYVGVSRPLARARGPGARRTLGALAVPWLAGVGIALAAPLAWPAGREMGECGVNKNLGYVIFSACGSFYLPAVVMSLLWWRVYRAASRRAQRLEGGRLPTAGRTQLRAHRGGTQVQLADKKKNGDWSSGDRKIRQSSVIVRNQTRPNRGQLCRSSSTPVDNSQRKACTCLLKSCSCASREAEDCIKRFTREEVTRNLEISRKISGMTPDGSIPKNNENSRNNGSDSKEFGNKVKTSCFLVRETFKEDGKSTAGKHRIWNRKTKSNFEVENQQDTVENLKSQSKKKNDETLQNEEVLAPRTSEVKNGVETKKTLSRGQSCASQKRLFYAQSKNISTTNISNQSNNSEANECALHGDVCCSNQCKNCSKPGGLSRNRFTGSFRPGSSIRSVLSKQGRLGMGSGQSRAARTLALVVGGFLICWCPFFIILPIDAACSSCDVSTAFTLAFWLGYFNSCINPFIYACSSREMRRAFRAALCRPRRERKLKMGKRNGRPAANRRK